MALQSLNNETINNCRHSRMKTFSQLSCCFFSFVIYVEERPWWPIQSPNRGRKEKANGKEGREIRSSLLILDLNGGKL